MEDRTERNKRRENKRPLTEKELLEALENGSDIDISDDEGDTTMVSHKEKFRKLSESESDEESDPFATDDDNSDEEYYIKASLNKSNSLQYTPKILRGRAVMPPPSSTPSKSHESHDDGNMSVTSELSNDTVVDKNAYFSTRILRSTAVEAASHPPQQMDIDNTMDKTTEDATIETASRTKSKKKATIEWRSVRNMRTTDNAPKIQLPQKEATPVKTPYKYFSNYLDHLFFERASFCTNLYAVRNETQNFQPSTSNEIQQLFALHGLLSIYKYPRISMHWAPHTRTDLFVDNMSEKRFFKLRTQLHIVDDSTRAPNDPDKFYKVRPMLDAIRERLLEHPLEPDLSIDEQMIPFKGQLSSKQYVKGKPSPWGLKNFVLCGKSGRPYDFVMYQGPTTELDKDLLAKHGFSTAIIMKLAERIPIDSIGHRLYFDNFFSTYEVFRQLLERNIFAAGTIRINRFSNPPLPADNVMKKSGRGTFAEVTNRDQNIFVTKWFDNKPIHMASNFVGVGNADTVKRYDKSKKEYIHINRPEVIQLYNASMGGVDLLDQMIQYYRIFIRSKKWTLRVIFHCFDLAIVSAWYDYREDCSLNDIPIKQQMDLLTFKVDLCKTLLYLNNASKRVGRPTTIEPEYSMPPPTDKRRRLGQSAEVRHDQVGHVPKFRDIKNAQRCAYEKCTAKTYILCTKCEVFLCVKRDANCFFKYHTQ